MEEAAAAPAQQAQGPYSWAAWGDVSAFFGLMLDNMADLVMFSGLLVGIYGFPMGFIATHMIPGTAFGVLLGDLAYTWMAFRLAKRTGRSDVCAMPLGLDTPSTIVAAVAVIGPAFAAAKGKGMAAQEAAMHAWYIGMAVLFVMGLAKIGLSFCGNWVRNNIPRAAMLGSLAATAVVLMGYFPGKEVLANPLVGLPAFGVILFTLTAGHKLRGNIPGALLGVGVGVILYYGGSLIGQPELVHYQSPPALELGFMFPWPSGGAFEVFSDAAKYLPLMLPWAVADVVGGIDCAESAAAAGDDYNTRNILLVEGFASTIAALFGGVIQTTPYIGHPAYKKMGGRAAYTLATALFIGLGGCVGYLAFLVGAIPKAAVAPILLFVALEIGAQAPAATPKKHYPALAIAFIPLLAYLIAAASGGLTQIAQTSPDTAHDLALLGNGFIVTAMLWAALVSYLMDGRTLLAVAICALCCLLTSFGVIHSPFLDGRLFLPTEIYELWLVSPWDKSAYISSVSWFGMLMGYSVLGLSLFAVASLRVTSGHES